MEERIDLSIPVPCHENWRNFDPVPQGGYCATCHKEVVDFTHWSENQIQNYFKNRNEPTCGRFRKDQLKSFSLSLPQPLHKFLPLSVLGLTLLLSPKEADGAARKSTGMEIISFKKTSRQNEVPRTDTLKSKTVRGTIVAEDDQSPLPGVTVSLKATELSTVSDVDGKFTLKIPAPKESDVLVFSFIGFESSEKTVSGSNEILVTLKPDVALLAEVVVSGVCVRWWTPGAIWCRIKSIFRKSH